MALVSNFHIELKTPDLLQCLSQVIQAAALYGKGAVKSYRPFSELASSKLIQLRAGWRSSTSLYTQNLAAPAARQSSASFSSLTWCDFLVGFIQ